MSGLVEMLEAFETKGKRDAKPIFEVCEWKIGSGFYVRATLPGREPERVEGFKSHAEAARWIKNESVVWLHQHKQANKIAQ